MEGGISRFGDDVSGIKADFSDGLAPGGLPKKIDQLAPSSPGRYPGPSPATVPGSNLPPVPSESSDHIGARILLRAGQAAARQSTGDKNRDEK